MKKDQWHTIQANMQRFAEYAAQAGFECTGPDVSKAASEEEVTHLERQLGTELPPSLRDFFLKVSGQVKFYWHQKAEPEFSEPFTEIFMGELDIGLSQTLDSEMSRRSWVTEVFPDTEDEYDRIWHNKFGFLNVGNGDVLAFDLMSENSEHVVFLSHEDGSGHGRILGKSFADFLLRYTAIACAGPDDFCWAPFWDQTTNVIDHEGKNANAFQALISQRRPALKQQQSLLRKLADRFVGKQKG